MFTPEDRAELIEIFDILKKEVSHCLENHNVLPASITHNLGKAGITIEFRKMYPESDIPEPVIPEPEGE